MSKFIKLHRLFPKEEEVYVNIDLITKVVEEGNDKMHACVHHVSGYVDAYESVQEVMHIIERRTNKYL